jgi:hypothetical protein
MPILHSTITDDSYDPIKVIQRYNSIVLYTVNMYMQSSTKLQSLRLLLQPRYKVWGSVSIE